MLSHLIRKLKTIRFYPDAKQTESGFGVKDILVIAGIIALTTAIGSFFHLAGFSDATVITLYILAVQIIAIQISGWKSNAAVSLICVIVYNFFFTNPKYTLLAYDPDYPITFVVMFFVSFLAGSIADRLKSLARESHLTLYRTQVLLDTSQLLSRAHEQSEVAEVLGLQAHKLTELNVFVALAAPDFEGSGESVAALSALFYPPEGKTFFTSQIEKEAAVWAMKSGKKSGSDAFVYQGAQGRYYPIIQNEKVYGVLGLNVAHNAPDHFTETILHSILNQCARAMETVLTAREKEQEKLRAQNEKLRADLLRAISHDLRTPLTSISGNASILLNSGETFDNDTKNQLYTDIYDDSIWLVNLVENLLSVSRAINGTMQLHCTMELLDDVIDEALNHVDRHAKNYHIHYSNGGNMILAKCDVHLIEQVIINLVNNAIKYTPSGSTIEIEVTMKGNFAHVSVTDNGPGILSSDLPHLFEMFYNGRKTAADASKSLGIGLALCKSIVEAHGGSISVANVQPHGARFTFTLPSQEINMPQG